VHRTGGRLSLCEVTIRRVCPPSSVQMCIPTHGGGDGSIARSLVSVTPLARLARKSATLSNGWERSSNVHNYAEWPKPLAIFAVPHDTCREWSADRRNCNRDALVCISISSCDRARLVPIKTAAKRRTLGLMPSQLSCSVTWHCRRWHTLHRWNSWHAVSRWFFHLKRKSIRKQSILIHLSWWTTRNRISLKNKKNKKTVNFI